MRDTDEIEIRTDAPDRPLRELGPVAVKAGSRTLFSKPPTREDVDARLRAEASRLGADAVIGVVYQGGVSMSSWKTLKARGTAVVFEAEQ